jgi:cytochrome P450 / NADPH-cytochrome P450 reductase
MTDEMQTQQIPHPRSHPLIGNAPEIGFAAPIQNMVKLARQYGPIYRLSFPIGSFIVLSSLELVRDACDETRFEKEVHLKALRDIGGDGLFTAYNDEPNWGKAHRILMPAFGPAAMQNYFEAMLDIAEQMLTRWERFGPEAILDITDNMTRLALDTIALCGFSYRFNSFYQNEMHPFVQAMVRAIKEANNRSRRPPLQNRLMLLTQRQFDADIRQMHEITDKLIARRRKLDAEAAPRDLLGLMLSAKDPVTGECLDDVNLRHQLVTFLVAGHETTSSLLSFAIYELLQHKEVLDRARAEVDEVLGTDPPRFEHLSRLHYIDQILRETLRCYPTAPGFVVRAKHDTLLAGRFPVTSEDPLLILLPALHRDPAVWQQPERFDPQRFAPQLRDKIPAHAWMPFGNGQRSCIGSLFALQEAILVLAMMLQRFEIWLPARYDLVIRETLTLKPAGLKIQAKVRQLVVRSPGMTRAAVALPEQASAAQTAASHGVPLLLLYGSNSGASEAFVRRIAGEASARGYAAKVAPLDDYAGELPSEGAILIITASYDGQPPDNAREFVDWLSNLPPASLIGIRYAVFGCGNRDWGSTYQAIPRLIDERLNNAGAHRLKPRGEADARGDFFGDFEHWYEHLWGDIGPELGVGSSTIVKDPLYQVEIVPSDRARLIDQDKLQYAKVVENRELVRMSEPFARSKRHLEFDLPPGMAYAAGDHLAMLPENDPEHVELAARRFGFRHDAAVMLHSTRGAMAASLPTERPLSIRELLGRHVELSLPATRKDLQRLAECAGCSSEGEDLQAIVSDQTRYRTEILEKRTSVLDLLTKCPSCAISLPEYLEMLSPMHVRQYSISSSPRSNPTRCSLTVAVLDAPAWSGVGLFRGTCSYYLARLTAGDEVPVAVRTPNIPFHPPASNATPIIMVCAGTGIAPFRGFLSDRATRNANGEAAGPALLFFGCDHPDIDFLYRDELVEWERQGLVRVLPAFAHQPDGDVKYVQHRLWQERERVCVVLEQGAMIFVSGDGSRMAPAAAQTIARIHQQRTGCSEQVASRWLADMQEAGRYLVDVFS